MNSITEQGVTLKKEKDHFKLSVIGKSRCLDIPGVYCENPKDPEAERIYVKKFTNNIIYMPNQYELAVKNVLRSGNDVVVLGANGFSDVNEEKCRAWGVQPGAYEVFCEGLLTSIVRYLRDVFQGIEIKVVDGASDMGIDKAMINVCKKINIDRLGFSCPRFLFYVKDDGSKIYVGKDQKSYSDSFVKSLDILVAANGREQAFRHDIDAAFLYGKHVIPVNVLRAISETGGPPAFGPDGKVEDAVTAFESRVHMLAIQMGLSGFDRWKVLEESVKETVAGICRRLISPERAAGLYN